LIACGTWWILSTKRTTLRALAHEISQVTDTEVWSSGSRSKRAGRSTERIDSQIIAKVTEPEEEQPATDGIDVAVEDDDDPYANVDQGDRTSLCGVLRGVILSVHFEVVFGVLIILNTLVMAIQQQYEGFRSAYEVLCFVLLIYPFGHTSIISVCA
jgi:hypothetical protein